MTLYKKPIATLSDGLPSVDLDDLESREPHLSQYERSDVTALPAAGVIGEAMLALVLADACLEKFGGDSMAELLAHSPPAASSPPLAARLTPGDSRRAQPLNSPPLRRHPVWVALPPARLAR